jgi:hypothetical protein
MIQIAAFTSNRADLIELQMRSFNRNIQEEFTYTIYNNSKVDRPEESPRIIQACKDWGVNVVDVELDASVLAHCNSIEKSCTMLNQFGKWSNPNCAGSYGCVYLWEKFLRHQKGAICLLHGDVFFDQPIVLTDYLKTTPLVFAPATSPGLGGDYMAECLVLMDMAKLPNPETIDWMGSLVNGIPTDGGGQTFFYLKAHPEIVPTHIQRWHKPDDKTVDFHPADYEVLAINDKPIALHYLRASNWNNRSYDYHVKKTAWLRKRLGLEAA